MQLVQKKHELVQPSQFSKEHYDLIKDMYFKNATDSEFHMFMHVCQRTGLDPTLRQIYPVKRYDSNLKRETMTVQTGIDGYRLIAERTRRYAPGREPSYQYKDGKLLSATAYVKKQTPDGTWHEISATAFYQEYVQTNKAGEPTTFWKKMGHNQLAKCAEALALRKAFPGDLSGIYTKEEMMQAVEAGDDLEIVGEAKEVEPKVDKISEQEAEELEEIFADCDPDFVERVRSWLVSLKPAIHDLKDMPKNMYDLTREKAIANRNKFQDMIYREYEAEACEM